MEELDDLDTGTPLDLWDHKLASEMRVLQEIFAEVVDKNSRVADHGRILEPQGRVIKNFSDTGLPAFLEFEMPAGAPYFTLEVAGNCIHQGLSDQARVPPSELGTSKPAPSRHVSSPPAPESKARVAPPPPVPPAGPPPQTGGWGVKPIEPVNVDKEQEEWKKVLKGKEPAKPAEKKRDKEDWENLDMTDVGEPIDIDFNPPGSEQK
jgi:hypothetical protein